MLETKRVFHSKEIEAKDEKGEIKKFDTEERVKIATISFAYRNKDIINKLLERGKKLTKGNFDDITPTE